MKACPDKTLENIMNGVSKYINSDDYSNMKAMVFEFAQKKHKIPNRNEFSQVTNWLLEMIVSCSGGNRPVAILGITVGKVMNDIFWI